ncbi:MAG: SURF1 family protein [Anaerolineales bacterium]|nr:SURF1 family protein [Anaerolineales bacterium]
MLGKLVGRRWIITSILVLAAAGAMVRLGIWQLDRLQQRKAFNVRVLTYQDQAPLELDDAAFQEDLYEMEYREVTVAGEYDFDNEVAWRNQIWYTGEVTDYGIHLLTPLRIKGSEQVILIDRGWVPNDYANFATWGKFAESGEVTVQGVVRRGQTEPKFVGVPDPTLMPGQERLDTWNFVNLERIGEQMDVQLPDVYIQAVPPGGEQELPYKLVEEVEIDNGPHLSYAIQWFSFSTILLVGYPVFVKRQEDKRN